MLPFISETDLSAFLGEEVSPLDLLTEIALDSACQTIRSYLGQTINLVRGDIEIHDGTGRESIVLRQLPVIDVASITEDDVELVPDDDYVVDGRTGIVHRRSLGWSYGWGLGWPWRRQNIIVIYDHGCAITEEDVVNEDSGDEPIVNRVPSDIRQVALELAAATYNAPAFVAVGASGITEEDKTIGGASHRVKYADAVAQAQSSVGDLRQDQRDRLDHAWPPVA